MSVTIFTITHKPFTPPSDPMYSPLHVGRSRSNDLGFLGDNSGDNISDLNPFFCELTGMYWIWKNHHDSDYVGICHYRRYLLDKSGSLFHETSLLPLLKEYDVITTKLLTLPGSYYDGFSANHHIKDLITTGTAIRKQCPEYYPVFEELIHGPNTYFGNIFIMSKKSYDRYCNWLFNILFEVYKQTDMTGYNGYQKRLFGFLSEFLQTVWIRYHGLSVCECMVGMIGAKYETETLKQDLAEFFSKKDPFSAKQCFLDAYRKRPDILMEASDIDGELRLCMQIISICEFESEKYGCCILDYINDYSNLITHIRKLNQTVLAYQNGTLTESEWNTFCNIPFITDVSIEIASKVCQNFPE